MPTAFLEFQQNEYTISTDPSRLDIDTIHTYLANESYWASGIPLEIVRKSIENSLCFGVYEQGKQIGFARVVSDRATFAWLCDVFILEPYRGHGLGKWLVHCVLNHPGLQNLRSWMLATQDAQSLYSQFGFKTLEHPESVMRRRNLHIYQE
jgi:N-acetylglutamate synthase-like GNAT family acetyltransferase